MLGDGIMSVYLSPGIFTSEKDISFLATGSSPIRPAFIGVANKGPMNRPVLITTAQQYIDTFGDPFPESYLGYAVLAFLEEGNSCYVQRVGVEYDDGLVDDLKAIAIDVSGSQIYGWGRTPVFTGLDYGKIQLRTPSADNPISFHDHSITDINFNDVNVDPSLGPTIATLNFTGAGLSDAYTGSIDDHFTLLITSPASPSHGSLIDGADYQILRGSDGVVIQSGTIIESGIPGTSNPITIGTGVDATGLICAIVASGTSPLEEQDVFTFSAHPDNRDFSFWIDREEVGGTPVINTHSFNNGETFTTTNSFVTRFNIIAGLGEDYEAVNIDGVPYVRVKIAGQSIQLMSTEAWALEVGQSLYAWDIPRAHLVGTDVGPYRITTNNNRVKIDVINNSTTTPIEFTIPVGLNQTVDQVAYNINLSGVYMGSRYWRSYALQVTDSDYYLIIETDSTDETSALEMAANYSNIRTLRFASEVGIHYPYQANYRGFFDPRVQLPAQGTIDPENPLSCEVDPGSAQCAVDSSYYQNIIGWIVANSPGTWIDNYTLDLSLFTEGVGNVAGRFKIIIKDSTGSAVERIEDVSFNPADDRYIGNVVNAGSRYGGVNGDPLISWEERTIAVSEDRTPSSFYGRILAGGENGIPTDPIYSSALDAVVIGNPALSTGIFAFQNSEVIEVDLLSTPGFSSGSVIGQAIQLCQARGDMLYIVDPPYGLRPQQVIDWHNGILLSDLTAAINSSYGALYWSWLEIFDQFSGEHIWVPPSGYTLGVYARTAREAEQWYAPAGIQRGRLFTPENVEYNPTMGERDALYGSGNAVNPIVNFTSDGITIWGQRTLQRRASALDRVNVRMLLIYIKKSLTRSLRPEVFEQDDQITWSIIKSICDGFLADIVARRGLEDFRCICDNTNNTPERRQRNELWVSIFLKPTHVAEYIQLNLCILRSDMSFTSSEVLAAGGVVAA